MKPNILPKNGFASLSFVLVGYKHLLGIADRQTDGQTSRQTSRQQMATDKYT